MAIATAKVGSQIKTIQKQLLGVSTSVMASGKVLASYGQTVRQGVSVGSADTTYQGIVLDGVVVEAGNTALLKEVRLYEYNSGANLQQGAMTVYLFDIYGMSIASGSAFVLDNTTTKLINLIGPAVIKITSSNYAAIDTKNAVALWVPSADYAIQTYDYSTLKAIVVSTDTKTYDLNSQLTLELKFAQD